jgi:hypothetical protein
MSYTIYTTNGNLYATIQDGTINNTSGINLIGRNYTSYGDAQNENFIKLLENFADAIPPTLSSLALVPLTGTLWYDTGNKLVKVYDGLNWYPVSQRIVANSAPTADNTGDQWYDTVNAQLKSWTGSAWQVVGPAYTASQGVTGTVPGTIVDTNNVTHIVANTYTAGNLVSIASYDSTFTPNQPIIDLATIQQGINLVGTTVINGNVTNSQTIGGVGLSSLARVDRTPSFAVDIAVAGNLVLGSYGNIHFTSNNNLVLHNHAFQGNVEFYTNSTLGNLSVLHIDGNSGLATIYADPVSSKGIATKNYVDTNVSALNVNITNLQNVLNATIGAQTISTNANLSAAIANTNANLTTITNLINSNVASLTASTTASFTYANANAAGLYNSIGTVANALPTYAPIHSPSFTGTPLVPATTAQITYQTNLNTLLNYYQLTGPLSITAGDYLTQVDPTSFVLLSNVRAIANNPSVSNVTVQIIAGTVSTLGNTLVLQNGTLTGVHVTAAGKYGPGPNFLGLGDSSLTAASTLYVDLTANLLYGLSSNAITAANAYNVGYTITAVAPKANIVSPAFTGNVTAPTPPAGDNSGNVATTAFVTGVVASQAFNYSVATSLPGNTSGVVLSTSGYNGATGNFWFVIG